MWLLSSVEVVSGLWSWFDILVLLVVAIVSVCFVCHSAFAQIEEARQKVREERFGHAVLDQYNAASQSLLTEDEYVKPFAGQSPVASAVTKLTELALRDFVLSWYTPFSDSQSFPAHLRTLIDVALSRLQGRATKVDWSVFVIESVVPNLTDLLRIYTVCEKELSRYPEYLTATEERKEEMLKEAITKIYTLHSAATSEKAAISYLRKVAMVLLSRLLNRKDFHCDSLRSFLRELIAVKILFPVLGFAIPYWFNVALVMGLGEAPSPPPSSSSSSSSSASSTGTTPTDTSSATDSSLPSTPVVGPKEKGTRILDSLLRVISEGYFTDSTPATSSSSSSSSSSSDFPAAAPPPWLSPNASSASSASWLSPLHASSAISWPASLISPASSSPPSPTASSSSNHDSNVLSTSSAASSSSSSTSISSSSSSSSAATSSVTSHSSTVSSSNSSSSDKLGVATSAPSSLCSAISIILPACAAPAATTTSSLAVSPFPVADLLSDNESERDEGELSSLRITRSLSTPTASSDNHNSKKMLTLTVNTADERILSKDVEIVKGSETGGVGEGEVIAAAAATDKEAYENVHDTSSAPSSPLPPLRRSNTLPVNEEKNGFFRLPGFKKSLASVMRLRSNSSVVQTQLFTASVDDEGAGGPEVTWNVQITGALSRYDPKPYWSYQLRVQRDSDERYHISKRYGQFEDLHKKLKKTYNFDAMLPTKRMFGNLDPVFVQARKVELQHYMDRLLSIRSIANSIVIEEFLRNSVESPSLNRRPTIEQSNRRLRPVTDTEQEEHSSPPSPVSTSQPTSNFPSSPAAAASSSSSSSSSSASSSSSSSSASSSSSSSGSTTQSSSSHATSSSASISSLNTTTLSLASLSSTTDSVPLLIPLSEDPACLPRSQHNAEPLFDFVDELFQLKKGWGVRASTLGMVRGFSRLALNEPVFGWLSKQIEGAITTAELVGWIEWAQLKLWPNDQLFVSQPDPSPEELRKYRQDAKACLRDTVPSSLFTLIGDKQVANGIHKLFTLFQIECLTRHLAYTCLDNLLLELFPEMQTNLRRCK